MKELIDGIGIIHKEKTPSTSLAFSVNKIGKKLTS
jgi:hypothetical protein